MRSVPVACIAVVCAIASACASPEQIKVRAFESGNRYFAEKKYAEAIVEYRNAIRADPRFGEARFKLAEAYVLTGDTVAAYSEQIRAADLLPDNMDAQMRAAVNLLAAGQFRDAKTRALRVLEREPRNVQALIILGNASAGMSDLIGAIAEIEQAIEIDPTASSSYTNLGSLRLAQGDRDQARVAFTKAVDVDPTSVAAWIGLAMFQWGTGETEAAERSFRSALALDTTDLVANRAIASYYIGTGRATQAEPFVKAMAAAGGDDDKMSLADYYIRLRRLDDARRVLDSVMQSGRAASSDAEIRVAEIAYAVDRQAEGHATLDRVIAREPRNPSALILKTRWLFREGKRQEALDRAKALIEIDPSSAAAFYLLGTIQAQAGDYDGATESLTEAVRLNPRAAEAQVQLSRITLARGNSAEAVWFAQEAAKSAPGDPLPRLTLARGFIAQGQTDRAAAELAGLLKQYPDAAPVRALSAAVKVQQKNYAGARQEYERALKIDPTSIDALTGLAMLEVSQNNTAAARARVDAEMAGSSNRPEVVALAARVYVAGKDYPKAETLLRHLIQIDRDNVLGYSLLGQVYLIQQKLDEARIEFEQRARLNPRDATARLMAAMIFEAQRNRSEAKRLYDEVLTIDGRSVIAANNLAYLYAEDGENLDRAVALAQSASQQARDNPAVRDTLGWVYYRKQVFDLAILAFEESVEKDPNNPLYRYHLGLAFAKQGNLGRARLAFESALKIKPDYEEAQQALKSLLG